MVNLGGNPMFLPLLLACAAAQTTVTLTPVDTDSISSVSSEDFSDNTLRAAWSNSSQGYVDGLLKFDLSGIPNASAIEGLTLRLYHQAGAGSPSGDPILAVYHSIVDNWSSTTDDIHPGVNQLMTGQITGVPTADLVPMDIVLNPSIVNWSLDLLDDDMTLIVRDMAGQIGRVSLAHFYGKDPLGAPPELIVTYSNKVGLMVVNLRHNVIAIFEAYNILPGDYAGIMLSRTGSGPSNISVGPCGTMSVGLSPRVFFLGNAQANGGGTAVITFPIPAGATGTTVWIQAVDFGRCRLSKVFNGVVL